MPRSACRGRPPARLDGSHQVVDHQQEHQAEADRQALVAQQRSDADAHDREHDEHKDDAHHRAPHVAAGFEVDERDVADLGRRGPRTTSTPGPVCSTRNVAQPVSRRPAAESTVPTAKTLLTSWAPVSWIVWSRTGIDAKCPATTSNVPIAASGRPMRAARLEPATPLRRQANTPARTSACAVPKIAQAITAVRLLQG